MNNSNLVLVAHKYMNHHLFYNLRSKIILTYQSSGDKFEEVASNNGSQKLSNPVEQSGKDGDLAAKS